jgi:DNA (cytosine-5)-methyltransferase 1
VRAIDLFSGCGGISCGLRESGFEVLAGADIEPKYIATFRHNFPGAKAITTDLSRQDPVDLMKALSFCRGDLDLLTGGPPCQGFSKNVPRKSRFLEQEQNTQVLTYLRYVEAWLPRFVLMENVAEMKNGFEQTYSEEVIDRLRQLGYEVDYGVINSADYGVPQRRRRAFFVGARDGLKPVIPRSTHTKYVVNGGLFGDVPGHVCVWDAIGDLPSVSHGGGRDPMDYATHPQNDFQRRLRGNQVQVRNHIARKLQPLQFERLAALQPGQGLKDLPDHLKTKGGYSGAYGRLTEDMVAPTITRWVFHPGSGRWGHPRDIRVITIREVARLQAFPDTFVFVGSYNDQAGQLGNAVPPPIAQAMTDAMVKQLS